MSATKKHYAVFSQAVIRDVTKAVIQNIIYEQ